MKLINFSSSIPLKKQMALRTWCIVTSILLGGVISISLLMITRDIRGWWNVYTEKIIKTAQLNPLIHSNGERLLNQKSLLTKQINKLHKLTHYPQNPYDHLSTIVSQLSKDQRLKEISCNKKNFTCTIQTDTNKSVLHFINQLRDTHTFKNVEITSFHHETNNTLVVTISGVMC